MKQARLTKPNCCYCFFLSSIAGRHQDHEADDRAVRRVRPVRAGQLRVLRPRDRPRPAGPGRVDLLVPVSAAAAGQNGPAELRV